jgi:hypothetical protein
MFQKPQEMLLLGFLPQILYLPRPSSHLVLPSVAFDVVSPPPRNWAVYYFCTHMALLDLLASLQLRVTILIEYDCFSAIPAGAEWFGLRLE